MKNKILYIDTDLGLGTPRAEIDDGAALIVLLASTEIEVAGIGSVFGNVPIKDSHTNLSRFLSFLNQDHIRLGFGSEQPLAGDLDWFVEWMQGYGKTPSWQYSKPKLSSSELIIDITRTNSEKITILSLGPMTNIAKAIQQYPDLALGVEEIVAMGGSFSEKPTPPEFNIQCDPKAVDIVLRSGIKTTMIGLNITEQVVFTQEGFSSLDESNQVLQMFKKQSRGWIARVEKMGWHEKGCALHDAIAALYLIRPELFKTVDAKIKISLDKDHWGVTSIQKKGGFTNHQIVTQINVGECHDHIWASIMNLETKLDG